MAPKNPDEMINIVRSAHQWRVRMDTPRATEADHEAFQAWLAADPRHEEMFGRAQTVWSALGDVSPSDFDRRLHRPSWSEHWWQFIGALSAPLEKRSTRFVIASIAAAMIMAGGLMLVLPRQLETVAETETPIVTNHASNRGETIAITLSDGSTMTLGAASKARVIYSGASRTLELIEGAVYVDVVSDRDRVFFVDAAAMKVTVTGTEFDVRRTDEAVRVSVAEGNVEVSYPVFLNDKPTSFFQRQSIVAGQQIAASRESGLEGVKPVRLSSVGAWRSDRLVYDGDPLRDLIADANRYSDRRVVIEGDAERIGALRIQGAFQASDIDGMLSSLALIHPVEVDRSEPDIIRIRDAASGDH
ncbi:MAG: FecR domain-containing protein [Pseudomonadota bacterium]